MILHVSNTVSPSLRRAAWEAFRPKRMTRKSFDAHWEHVHLMWQNHRLNQPSYTALDFLYWFSMAAYVALYVAVVAKYVVPMVLK